MLNKFEKKLIKELLKNEDFNTNKKCGLKANEIEKWLFTLINKKEENNDSN